MKDVIIFRDNKSILLPYVSRMILFYVGELFLCMSNNKHLEGSSSYLIFQVKVDSMIRQIFYKVYIDTGVECIFDKQFDFQEK